MTFRIEGGDIRDVVTTLPAGVFDACVTDPPYEIGFMGHAWDSSGVAFDSALWLRIRLTLKPGAALLAFAHPRREHRVACALEDAGFVIEDKIAWFFTTGMPKTHHDLKPAYEPIIVARNPGPGRLFPERCLVPYRDAADLAKAKAKNPGRTGTVSSAVYGASRPQQIVREEGRRPTNAIMDEGVAEGVGEASRIVFVPKARGERHHPTEKPVALMRHLLRLSTPEHGLVLDPFCGSGSTLVAAQAEGMHGIGVERDPTHAETARRRLT